MNDNESYFNLVKQLLLIFICCVAPHVRLPDNQTNAITVSNWLRAFRVVNNGKSLVNGLSVFLLYKTRPRKITNFTTRSWIMPFNSNIWTIWYGQFSFRFEHLRAFVKRKLCSSLWWILVLSTACSSSLQSSNLCLMGDRPTQPSYWFLVIWLKQSLWEVLFVLYT